MDEFFPFLSIIIFDFQHSSIIFRAGVIARKQNIKGRKILTMLNLISGVIRLKIRSFKSAIIPCFKFLWLRKFESLLCYPFETQTLSNCQ